MEIERRRTQNESRSRIRMRGGGNVWDKPDLFREGVVSTIYRGRFPDFKREPTDRAFPSRVAVYQRTFGRHAAFDGLLQYREC